MANSIPIRVDREVARYLSDLARRVGYSRPVLIRELAQRFGEQLVEESRLPREAGRPKDGEPPC